MILYMITYVYIVFVCLVLKRINDHDKIQDIDGYLLYVYLYDTNCSELWNTEVYGMMTVRTIHLSTMHEVHKTNVPPPRAKMPFIVSGRVEADRIREELFGCAAWRMKDGYVWIHDPSIMWEFWIVGKQPDWGLFQKDKHFLWIMSWNISIWGFWMLEFSRCRGKVTGPASLFFSFQT